MWDVMYKKTMIWRMIAVVLAIGAAVLLQGCAAPASSSAMAVTSSDRALQTNPMLNGAMHVRSVTGGKETNPAFASQVDNASFKSALSQSLDVVGYASPSISAAKYHVDAELQALSQPMFGLTFDVTSVMRYTVEGNGQRKVYPVTAVGTATTSDAFVGVERLRIANERSIKESIKIFLRDLSLTFGK